MNWFPNGEPNHPESYGAANRDIIRVLLTPTAMWSGAFALASFLCVVSLLRALRLRRISEVQTHAG